jgi:hypothetical protein
MMNKSASQRTSFPERRCCTKESEVLKGGGILVEILKCKVWECLAVKERHQKENSGISANIIGWKDALLWPHLFYEENA